MRVLVTGGAGYVGSHTVVELLNGGFDVAVLDNLHRGHRKALVRVEQLTGRKVEFHLGDICDRNFLDQVFSSRFDAVIHFAALKAVEESTRRPAEYYCNNVGGTGTLCQAMNQARVKRMVFSSSAAVYGDRHRERIRENAQVLPINPYGETKLACERILGWLASSCGWSSVSLRYFNPVGAHASGRIGEDQPEATNIMPILLDTALGRRAGITVFGNDYPTRDGSCIRDYVHVVDVATAHIAAVGKALELSGESKVYNIGTGKGHSVYELVEAVREVAGLAFKSEDGPRRPGDAAELVADPSLAEAELGWKSRLSLREMVETAWKWRSGNPEGYRG